MRRMLLIGLALAAAAQAAEDGPPPGSETPPELQVEPRDDAPPAGSEVPPELQVAPQDGDCLLYTSPSPRDKRQSRMPSSA